MGASGSSARTGDAGEIVTVDPGRSASEAQAEATDPIMQRLALLRSVRALPVS